MNVSNLQDKELLKLIYPAVFQMSQIWASKLWTILAETARPHK